MDRNGRFDALRLGAASARFILNYGSPGGPTAAQRKAQNNERSRFDTRIRLVDDDAIVLAKAQASLDSQEWRQLDAYWRAANYLSVGQIYLYENPMLREPLTLAHVKPLVVGHWGTTPGQNFIYVHLNRTIKLHDLDMIYIAGPGHGGPAWSPTPISRAATARSIPTSARTKPG